MFKDLFSYAQMHQRPRDDVVSRVRVCVCVKLAATHARSVRVYYLQRLRRDDVDPMLRGPIISPAGAHTHDVCSPECLMRASGVSVVDEGYIPRLLMK